MKKAKFGKERFPPEKYQRLVGDKASESLHKNSKELAEILKSNGKIKKELRIFEMGAGPCRNLYYIWKEENSVELYANDLCEKSSRESMNTSIEKIINFYEGDSEEIFNSCKVEELDLLLVSDHFMHLQYDKADKIITSILKNWKPKNILLREIKEEFESVGHPRLFHKYNRFLEDYSLICESSSAQDDHYFIWLLERK